jgi:hypothetical protein
MIGYFVAELKNDIAKIFHSVFFTVLRNGTVAFYFCSVLGAAAFLPHT